MPHDPEAFADRVVMTVKAAMAHVLERLAAAEARLTVLGDLRDRVVTVETKAAMPLPAVVESAPPVDLAPVLERVADLRDRVVAMETKSAIPAPVPVLPEPVDLAPLADRVSKVEMRLDLKATEYAPVQTALTDLTKDIGSIRERLAVVEVRPVVPGPPGEPGAPGAPGENGRDGLAGLSFEGVYQEGQTYHKGHLVTWGGSSWHCNETTTTKPGDGSKAWTLMVKRGRDGKDGRDATGALPIVTVGSRA
jgi:hypothetical protein